MGNQSSEMKDKYKGEPEVTLQTHLNERFQPPKLHDHHVNGPSKVEDMQFFFFVTHCCVYSGNNPDTRRADYSSPQTLIA